MTTSSTIWPTIAAWGKGDTPTPDQREQVANWMLNPAWADVWKIDASSVEAMLNNRIRLLQAIGQRLSRREIELPLPGDWTDSIELMWTLWLPLALSIDRAQRTKAARADTRLFVQGILGGQGTGKTTLAKVLRLLLNELGQQAAILSIDDLYLTYAERCELKRQDPRFVWRGPPGTHDISLGIQTLADISSAQPDEQVALPRFDKSLYGGKGDRTQPALAIAPTVVLFEGWCVGVQPLDEAAFADLSALPSPINTESDRLFAKDCNSQLSAYLPLWSYLDSLTVLRPEDYRLSQQWRQQAERQMISQGKSGLSESEIAAFVTYFWRALHPQLFIEPLTRSDRIDLIAIIHKDHKVISLASP